MIILSLYKTNYYIIITYLIINRTSLLLTTTQKLTPNDQFWQQILLFYNIFIKQYLINRKSIAHTTITTNPIPRHQYYQISSEFNIYAQTTITNNTLCDNILMTHEKLQILSSLKKLLIYWLRNHINEPQQSITYIHVSANIYKAIHLMKIFKKTDLKWFVIVSNQKKLCNINIDLSHDDLCQFLHIETKHYV